MRATHVSEGEDNNCYHVTQRSQLMTTTAVLRSRSDHDTLWRKNENPLEQDRVYQDHQNSHVSSTRSAAVIARAKAEAAKVHVQFAEKEMEMKLENARIEASVGIFNVQKEAAAAEAEANALEAAAEQIDHELKEPNVPVCTENPMQRTCDT